MLQFTVTNQASSFRTDSILGGDTLYTLILAIAVLLAVAAVFLIIRNFVRHIFKSKKPEDK